MAISLDTARAMIAAAFATGAELGLKPLAVIVLDAGGHAVAFERQDGASNLRWQIAHGKAHGALGLGMGSRAIRARAEREPAFVAAVNGAFGGALIPAPGGVLVRDGAGAILGAVGITGDTSDNDEACAVAAIAAAGFVPDPG